MIPALLEETKQHILGATKADGHFGQLQQLREAEKNSLKARCACHCSVSTIACHYSVVNI